MGSSSGRHPYYMKDRDEEDCEIGGPRGHSVYVNALLICQI